MPDILALKEWTVQATQSVTSRSWPAATAVTQWTIQTARLMVGVPDYETYVRHRNLNHPGQPIMTYEEFFVERQEARYAVGKGRFRGCC